VNLAFDSEAVRIVELMEDNSSPIRFRADGPVNRERLLLRDSRMDDCEGEMRDSAGDLRLADGTEWDGETERDGETGREEGGRGPSLSMGNPFPLSTLDPPAFTLLSERWASSVALEDDDELLELICGTSWLV
jgi:hypothetical protein